MSECRGCGVKIDWVRTMKGGNMPVEGDYLNYDELKTGETIITDYGNVYKKKDGDNMPSVKGRISHFAVCPQADFFRKKKA